MKSYELVAAFSDAARAREVAQSAQATLLIDEREDTAHLPFAALVYGVTDDLTVFTKAADVGAYLICNRVIKSRSGGPEAGRLPGVVGVFTLVAHPEMGHATSDAHWRDKHAPLALKVHVAMSNYRQFSIVHCFHGPQWDGFALCGFDSLADLRDKFFDTPEGEVAIAKDVARFADGRKSPRRIIATEIRFAAD